LFTQQIHESIDSWIILGAIAMTNAITILMNEHRFLEQVLGSLETFVQAADLAQPAARQQVAGYAEFFREFADRCHHGKEENQLFATLHRQGMPLHQGPLAVMRHEHELGRNYVRELTALGAGSDGLDSTEQGRLREAATGYGELLRAHIQKEDNVLFPLALQTLSADTLAAVTDAFHRFEQDEMGEQVHERLHALAESLIAAYPPAPMPAATFAGCGCVGREC
jgi:hemerythrin-like domain-containing protein